MAGNVERVLDEKLAAAECQDPKGMYFDGSSWVKGEAPGQVPKTKAIFHGQMNGKFACGVDLEKFAKHKAEEEAKVGPTHAKAQEKVVFRSQYAQMDWREKWEPELKAEKVRKAKFPSTKLQFYDQDNPYGEEDPLDTLDNWHKEFNETMEEVEIDGKPYYEYGADAGGRKLKAGPMKGHVVSQIDIPPLFRIPKGPDKMTLYDHEGNLKKEGDGPLGVAYDAEGIPVPDWEIVDTSKTAAGVDVLDEQGRRKGALQVRGVVRMKDYANGTKRCYPQWGKRFGLVTKPRVGRFGSLTIDEAKLCLTTEDFGFKLGEDASKAPTPPLLRLRYGEVHNEPESVALFTGLSEIHLSHKMDIKEVHYMLQSLGYVCYNVPTDEDDDAEKANNAASSKGPTRFWGEGIDINPAKVYRGDGGTVDNKTQGPTYYSWYYRLPPFVAGLALEGEEGDPLGGPEARLRLARAKKLEQQQADLNEERLLALKARCKEAPTMPWYRDYFPNGEYDYETGKMINAPGTLPGETPIAGAIEGQIDDDKE